MSESAFSMFDRMSTFDRLFSVSLPSALKQCKFFAHYAVNLFKSPARAAIVASFSYSVAEITGSQFSLAELQC